MAVRELSAFLPAYDEEPNIGRTVPDLVAALDRLPLDRFEVIVVDDGSRDATAAVADGLAAADPRVRLVRHDRNRGYGAALRTGFASARYDWVFFTDADGQFDPAEVGLLLDHADRADAVLGYRRNRADHAGRRLNTWLWGRLVWLAVGVRARDVDCAFKLIRRDVLAGIGPLEADGAVISAELLANLQRRGARLAEVAVTHRPRRAGQASGADPRVIARALRELVRLRRRLGEPSVVTA
jgi:glycosyltransferase involved in cell wall biosynthesis